MDFDIKILSHEDGSFEAFKADWESQCGEVGEVYADYAPDVLALICDIVDGNAIVPVGTGETKVGALWDADSKRFYAACVLHRAMLPNTPGYTLRVRHLIVSPLIDYGVSDVQMYPDVVVGVMLGIVHLSSSVLQANNIHLHLRSPEDMAYFRAFGVALGETRTFATVQTRGSWLYVEKVGAVVPAPVLEEK